MIENIINFQSEKGGVKVADLTWGYEGLNYTLLKHKKTSVADSQLLTTKYFGVMIIFEVMGDTILHRGSTPIYVRPGSEVILSPRRVIKVMPKVIWARECRFPTYQEILSHTNASSI